jgi:hypothetical protein
VTGTLGQAAELQPLNIAANPDAKGLAIGFGITWALALLRHFVVWFPLHPLGYVLAASSFSYYVWFTCFAAWAIRSIVLKVGGPHTVRNGLVPFAIGMFMACIASVVVFEIVGFIIGPETSAIYNRLP